MTHTPGPWYVSDVDDPDPYRIHCGIRSTTGALIALPYRGAHDDPLRDLSDDELDYNTHLIAAAPDLLQALESVRSNMRAISETNRKWTLNDQRVYEKVCAAIAKAEGRE